MYWIAIAVVALLLLLWCFTEGMATHVRANDTSEPMPLPTNDEMLQIEKALVDRGFVRGKNISEYPRGFGELVTTLQLYIRLRKEIFTTKAKLREIEHRISLAKATAVLESLRTQQKAVQVKLGSQIIAYNNAAAKLRAAQKREKLFLIKF